MSVSDQRTELKYNHWYQANKGPGLGKYLESYGVTDFSETKVYKQTNSVAQLLGCLKYIQKGIFHASMFKICLQQDEPVLADLHLRLPSS